MALSRSPGTHACRSVLRQWGPYSSLHPQQFRAFSLHHPLREAASPPMLTTLRTDLKTAMRAKDTARLTTIRSLLASITDASKTSQPITSDLALLALIRKRLAASRTAIDEFRTQGRTDLVEKEEGQVAVLEEYASNVKVWGEDEVRGALEAVVKAMKGEGKGAGEVMKRVLGKDGELEGKPVDRGAVAGLVKRMLAE